MGFETRLKTSQIIFKSKINREVIPNTWTNNKICTTCVSLKFKTMFLKQSFSSCSEVSFKLIIGREKIFQVRRSELMETFECQKIDFVANS